MSHFSVLVVGDDYDELLAPFNENNSVEPYWRPVEPMSEHWIEHTRTQHPDVTDDDELYELAVTEWCGGDPVRKTGDREYEFESTYNPLSKWDWYQLGGRWRGLLLLKVDAEGAGVCGEKSWGGEVHTPTEGGRQWVDRARKRDVDWDGMVSLKVEALRKEYRETQGTYMDRIRQEQTEDDYVIAYAGFGCYAYLDANGWQQKGEMGWFGMATDEDDNWDEQFAKLLDAVDDDDWLNVVDCHI